MAELMLLVAYFFKLETYFLGHTTHSRASNKCTLLRVELHSLLGKSVVGANMDSIL